MRTKNFLCSFGQRRRNRQDTETALLSRAYRMTDCGSIASRPRPTTRHVKVFFRHDLGGRPELLGPVGRGVTPTALADLRTASL